MVGPSWTVTRAQGGLILSQDQEFGQEELTVPEYVASRGARLEGILGRVSDAPLRDGNKVALLRNGPDTYDDWLAAIARAQRWIHLDNYIFANDEIGNRFAEALSAKAGGGGGGAVAPRLFGGFGGAPLFWEGHGKLGRKGKGGNPARLWSA